MLPSGMMSGRAPRVDGGKSGADLSGILRIHRHDHHNPWVLQTEGAHHFETADVRTHQKASRSILQGAHQQLLRW